MGLPRVGQDSATNTFSSTKIDTQIHLKWSWTHKCLKLLFLPSLQPWSINQPLWTICCTGHWEPITSSEGRSSSLAYLVSCSLLEHSSSEGFLSACEYNTRLPVWSIPTSYSCNLGWPGLPRWRASLFEIINALIDLVCLHFNTFLEAQETQIPSQIPSCLSVNFQVPLQRLPLHRLLLWTFWGLMEMV